MSTTNLLESSKEEIVALNKRRKKLLLDLHHLKKQRFEQMCHIQQNLSTYLEDYAEKYFDQEGEWAEKTFALRYEVSLKMMKTELRSLEQGIGINLHDMDDDIDRSITKLANREKEFDQLEGTLRVPIAETKEFKDLMEKFMTTRLNLNPELEYGRLQQFIARKETFETQLHTVVTKREKQLEKELESLRQVFRDLRGQKRTLLESIAEAAMKDLTYKHQQYSDQVHAEYEVQLRKALKDQADLHHEYARRYGNALAALQKRPPSASPLALEEADLLGDSLRKGNLLEQDGTDPSCWKAEILDRQEEMFAREQKQREEEHEKHEQMLQSLQSKPISVADPTPLADLANKLGALYLRYNDTMLEMYRR
eukprot:gene9166-10118_t